MGHPSFVSGPPAPTEVGPYPIWQADPRLKPWGATCALPESYRVAEAVLRGRRVGRAERVAIFFRPRRASLTDSESGKVSSRSGAMRTILVPRSEERRVGKEGRPRW